MCWGQALDSLLECSPVGVGHHPVTDLVILPVLFLVFLQDGVLPYCARYILRSQREKSIENRMNEEIGGRERNRGLPTVTYGRNQS